MDSIDSTVRRRAQRAAALLAISFASCLPTGVGSPPPNLTTATYQASVRLLRTARPRATGAPLGTPRHWEVIGTVPTWSPSFTGCNALRIMPQEGRGPTFGTPADPDTRTLVTVRDFTQYVVYDACQWRNSDGAQVKLYIDPDQTTDVYLNIAGSVPSFAVDLNSLTENLASQSNMFPGRGYVEFVRLAVEDAVRSFLPRRTDGKRYRLFLSGHSQGGNVSQVIAVGLLSPRNAQGQAEYGWTDDPGWQTVRSLMNERRVDVGGVIPVASRPHGLMALMNQRHDGRGTFALFVQTLDDVVPRLSSPSQAALTGDRSYANLWDSLMSAVGLFSLPTYAPSWLGGGLFSESWQLSRDPATQAAIRIGCKSADRSRMRMEILAPATVSCSAANNRTSSA